VVGHICPNGRSLTGHLCPTGVGILGHSIPVELYVWDIYPNGPERRILYINYGKKTTKIII